MLHVTYTDKILIQASEKSGQSPIDLIDKIVCLTKFPPLIISGHWLKDGNATLFNNGVTGDLVRFNNLTRI